MKKVIFSILLMFSPILLAQQNNQAIEDLIIKLDVKAKIDNARENQIPLLITNQIQGMIKQRESSPALNKLTKDENKKISEGIPLIIKATQNELEWGKLKPIIYTAYQNNLTNTDLQMLLYQQGQLPVELQEKLKAAGQEVSAQVSQRVSQSVNNEVKKLLEKSKSK